MNKNDEIRNTLLEILRIGLLRIRAFGFEGSAEVCSMEADHLHNLPTAIQSGGQEELLHYYNIERLAFLQQSPRDTEQFRSQWDRLASLIGG